MCISKSEHGLSESSSSQLLRESISFAFGVYATGAYLEYKEGRVPGHVSNRKLKVSTGQGIMGSVQPNEWVGV